MITGIAYDHEMILVLDLQKFKFVSGVFFIVELTWQQCKTFS